MERNNLILLLLLAGFLLAIPNVVHAQPGGGGGPPGGFARFLDRNGNGMVDPEELSSERSAPLREALAKRGIDITRPIPVDKFNEQSQGALEEMRRSRDEQRNSSDRPTDPGRSDSNRGRDESSRRGPESPPGNMLPGGNMSPGSRSEGRGNSPPKPLFLFSMPPRAGVTFKLPEAYVAKDLNHDGQIGMYEWPRADLATFKKLDRDGDGFLTPFELIKAADPKATLSGAPALAATGAVTGVVTGSAPTTSGSGSGSSPGGPNGSSSSRDGRDNRDTNPAGYSFDQLDRDKNGSISDEEWQRSRTARGLFEKAGIKVTLPIARDTFLQHYAQASAAAGSTSR